MVGGQSAAYPPIRNTVSNTPLNTLTRYFLQEPVTALKGVGPRLAERLKEQDIEHVQDILFRLPTGYQDRTQLISIRQLYHGRYALIEGEVQQVEWTKKGKPALICHISDRTGSINLRFFHYRSAAGRGLSQGTRLRCFGEARSLGVHLEMIHPEYDIVTDNTPINQHHLTPIYPTIEGISQTTWRRLVQQALEVLTEESQHLELLPPTILTPLALPTLTDALLLLHAPPKESSITELVTGHHPAHQRLAFEELLTQQLSLARFRAQQHTYLAPTIQVSGQLIQQLKTRLPFVFTAAQERVLHDIQRDMLSPHPMLRLIQGDVGSGKTLVALSSMLLAIEAGFQTALMAPTELLTEQHQQTFTRYLTPLNVPVFGLRGNQSQKERESTLNALAEGTAQIVVGTQALFQEHVHFAKLALIVIDEQHRFGVQQRLNLRDKGVINNIHPHQIVMSATPIPRTLAMTAYADLDISIIDELPPGRQPINTTIIAENHRHQVIERVRLACQAGRQVYWVCPLIEDSDILQCQAAEATYTALQTALTTCRIGLVHGRLKTDEKQTVMQRFASGELQLLVATTVIEVGVDVPNASIMIIENAERLGLAQLHQLRGRVGRGNEESFCILMYHAPLGYVAKQRLTILRKSQDGFYIAEQDLKIRGPGEILGTKQTGLWQLRIADFDRDHTLIAPAQQAARLITQHYSHLIDPLIHRWLGTSERFRQV